MKNNSCRSERNVDVLLGVLGPVQDLLNVLLLHVEVITVTHGGLKEHTDGVRQVLYKIGKCTLKINGTEDNYLPMRESCRAGKL